MRKLFLSLIFNLLSIQTMASDILIRKLQLDDWESLRELRLTALRQDPKAYGIAEVDESSKTEEEWKALCQEASNGQGKWYTVAQSRDGKLIGMLGAVEVFGSLMRHQVEIVQAYVDPNFRRMKIMERLFTSLKQQLEEVDHLEQMIVWVTLHEEAVGKQMFERFGFKLAGKLSKTVKLNGKYYDCCWLEAPLKNEEIPR